MKLDFIITCREKIKQNPFVGNTTPFPLENQYTKIIAKKKLIGYLLYFLFRDQNIFGLFITYFIVIIAAAKILFLYFLFRLLTHFIAVIT
jgi:hypothetical protein